MERWAVVVMLAGLVAAGCGSDDGGMDTLDGAATPDGAVGDAAVGVDQPTVCVAGVCRL